MKSNRIRQINGFFNMGFFEVIKLFFCYLAMNNPIIYIGLFPTPKNTFHNSIFSFYPASQNLKAIGLQFFKLFYVDFSYSIISKSIVIFISINCHKFYYKKHIFIGNNFKNCLFTLKGYKSYLGILKNPLINNKGFAYTSLIESIFKYSFFIILSFLIALITSLSDIEIPSFQEYTNDIQYAFRYISILLF
jgi:hypothetical protein